jgi:hypothetical protein
MNSIFSKGSLGPFELLEIANTGSKSNATIAKIAIFFIKCIKRMNYLK